MKRKPNIIIEGEITKLELTQGQWAIVDTEDLERLPELQKLWYAKNDGIKIYAAKMIARKMEFMHNYIAGEMSVDHISGSGLDNRRANLRMASHWQNTMNRRVNTNTTTGYKGVSKQRDCPSNPYRASIRLKGVRRHLGSFPTAVDAAKAYDKAAIDLFGEFAWLNFPNPSKQITLCIDRQDGKGDA
jgi:hypothetical protein